VLKSGDGELPMTVNRFAMTLTGQCGVGALLGYSGHSSYNGYGGYFDKKTAGTAELLFFLTDGAAQSLITFHRFIQTRRCSPKKGRTKSFNAPRRKTGE
jgi:hypothetical protein